MKQILVFVLFAGIVCWCMFAPIYKHTLIMRQAILQQEVDYLLEIGANGSHGFVDGAMISESKERLRVRGFRPEQLVYDVDSSTGTAATDPASPLLRGIGLEVHISYPYEKLFVIDRLMGIDPPSENDRMSANGMKMSEYIPTL